MDKREISRLSNVEISDAVRRIKGIIKNTGEGKMFFSWSIAFAYWAKYAYSVEDTCKVMEEYLPSGPDYFLEDSFKDMAKSQIKNGWESIRKISDTFDSDTLKAIILKYETLLTDCGDINYYLSPEFDDFILKLLDIEGGHSLLNIGAGTGGFVFNAAKYTSKQIYGLGLYVEEGYLAMLRKHFFGFDNVNIDFGDAFDGVDYKEFGADRVFTDLPLLNKEKHNFSKIDFGNVFKAREAELEVVTGDWRDVLVSIAALGEKIEDGGRAVALVSNTVLWKKRDREIRKLLVESGVIESIITMHDNMLMECRTPFSVVVISKGNRTIKMLNAQKVVPESYIWYSRYKENEYNKIYDALTKPSEFCREVSLEDIANKDYDLTPETYINDLDKDEKLKDARPLGELCKLIRGLLLTPEEREELIANEITMYRYLSHKSIGSGVDTIEALKEWQPRFDNYAIESGDILMTKASAFKLKYEPRAACFTMANSNIYILRMRQNEEIEDPLYIMLYLQSPEGMKQLNHYAKGANIKNISLKDLEKVRIPIIPPKEQNKIIDAYWTKEYKIHELKMAIKRETTKFDEVLKEVF